MGVGMGVGMGGRGSGDGMRWGWVGTVCGMLAMSNATVQTITIT